VDGVGSKVDGAAWRDEVVHAYAELGCEVPNAGVGGVPVIELVVGRAADAGVLVVGPDHSSATLCPRSDLAVSGAGEVPAEKDWRDGDTRIGSPGHIRSGADSRTSAGTALKLRGVGLPEGEDLDGVFEVAVNKAGADIGSEHLSCVAAEHEELIVAAIIRDAQAALSDYAELQRAMRRGERCRRGRHCLRVGRRRGEQGGERQCAEG